MNTEIRTGKPIIIENNYIAIKDNYVNALLHYQEIKPDNLIISDDGKTQIGKPTVKGGKVTLKIVEAEVKGEKIYIKKYKAKSRYRKRTGFRPKYTKLLVQTIK